MRFLSCVLFFMVFALSLPAWLSSSVDAASVVVPASARVAALANETKHASKHMAVMDHDAIPPSFAIAWKGHSTDRVLDGSSGFARLFPPSGVNGQFSADQRWEFHNVDKLRLVGTNRCLFGLYVFMPPFEIAGKLIPGYPLMNFGMVQECPPAGSINPSFSWTKDGDFLRWGQNPNMCLTVQDGYLPAGSPTQLANCDVNNEKQRFTLLP